MSRRRGIGENTGSGTEKKFNFLPTLKKETSMSTLIVWNVSKALKSNPCIDLRSAIREAQERLDHDPRDLDMMSFQYPEERHLACAVLAWQQLGHHDADSLYQFIERKKEEINISPRDTSPNVIHFQDATCSMATDSVSINSCTMGPVVKLPIQTNIVMRMESVPNTRPKKPRAQEKDIMDKIDAACCLESGCLERLSALDKTTNELRSRAARLAKRESERVELLERAEAAWKDLEIGYQRRLGLAEEKEEDMAKQIQKLIEERNGNKKACTVLAKQLKERGDVAEKERSRLTKIEKDVYDRACIRLRLSEEAARCDSALAEQQCKAAQLDRDLQFKEEQARRKILSLESEAESARTLAHEAERAMRAELGALRDQISKVSTQLLGEDKDNSLIKVALEQLRTEKMELVEDLEGCKVMCDNRMQGRVDELNKRREQLKALKEKVMECRCKLPVDESVEVKRTPSLAALCRCSPEDKLVESCSCTSLRTKLLSNLFSDLFGGLQAELGGSGTQMPCQLLKCLEDKHNWDRASIVKTNLRNYFSKLLIGELDIAIATAIEKYHAKWVGASCADQARLIPDPGELENEGWQERALERKAQKLATQLAEQLFKERAEQLEKRVKDIVASGPPPCECSPKTGTFLFSFVSKWADSAFTCMVKQNMHVNEGKTAPPAYWQRTAQDITQLRMQIEALKKESIKKEDLKIMEDNLMKMVQRASLEFTGNTNMKPNRLDDHTKNGHKSLKTNTESSSNFVTSDKPSTTQKKQLFTTSFKKEQPKKLLQAQMDNKSIKPHKRFRQDYAVNMCLCSNSKSQKQQPKLLQNVMVTDEHNRNCLKQKSSKDNIISQISSIRQTKPINTLLPSSAELATLGSGKESAQFSCLSNCVCFHKMPSNTSIDKLLETLARWKCDLDHSNAKIKNTVEQGTLIATDMNNIFSTKCSSNLKNFSKSDDKQSTDDGKIPLNKSNIIFNDKIQLNINEYEDDNVKSILPTTTESEYMGAINLDKSNENFCKCVQDVDNKNSKVNSISIKSNKGIPLKCMISTICNCKQPQLLNNTDTDKDSLNQSPHTKETELSGVQIISNNELSNDTKLEEMEPSVALENILKTCDKKQEGLFTCDSDYYVNFLGITLADAHPNEHNTKTFTDMLNSEKDKEKIFHDNPSKTFMLQSSVSMTPENLYNGKCNTEKSTFLQSISNKKLMDCDCMTKFEELKDLIHKMLDAKTEKNISNRDKSMDTKNMQLSPSTNENCICCNNHDLEESKNLEENTFQLIEEHLKEKLDEFKISFCKSSCIPPNEEDKLFSVILRRVKEVISSSTKEMICKCADDTKFEGSWNRAYGLLKEYLKMKLKRVQCSCGSTSKNNDMMIPLSNILEKVCLLIENDFERLKNICNCKNLMNSSTFQINSSNTNICMNDLPERDTHNTCTNGPIYKYTKNDSDSNSDIKCKQNSNKSIIYVRSISSQVPQNLGMENKSCNAMEKGFKNIQIQESKNMLFNKSCKTSLCSCSKKQNDRPFLELLGTNELYVSHCTEIETTDKLPNSVIVSQLLEKNSNVNFVFDKTSVRDVSKIKYTKCIKKETNCVQETKLPYVGKTVDCSCDGKISSCVCMKSVVQTNNDEILSIWKVFTQNIKCQPKVSYIMNSIIDRSEQEKSDIMNLTTDIYASNFPERYSLQENPPSCDIKISPLQTNEDIVLKNSKEILNQSHHMTNTYSDNFSSDYSNIDDAANWYDCKLLDKSRVSLREEIIDLRVPKTSNSCRVNLLNNGESPSLHSEVTTCDCNTVPVCHIKMLVESIEKKLANEQCTCDSLIPRVCPVHAAKTSL
ncbi:hypothetical protein K1T71_003265 [Dendrolimus kikuchii]|uniref:Uncharacterized protein n=1 Tax=Dendrolimus kikuchii TaxID=765133 RepID=A0ACC1DBH4_9NEOP|nr:hypothetical protein K1T71_003265 [Dendrolimus kikuchii]